ncbi:hypothetical protein E4T56_gene5560 [Termitomyces sp. T112]|nr:hypothetical protein E4T56_gene5560 [Termitomyces sp. T112]
MHETYFFLKEQPGVLLEEHGPVALASFQTQPHLFDPTSLCLVSSLYFQLNAKSQTQPHFVQLGPCISNSMLSPRPNLTLFS